MINNVCLRVSMSTGGVSKFRDDFNGIHPTLLSKFFHSRKIEHHLSLSRLAIFPINFAWRNENVWHCQARVIAASLSLDKFSSLPYSTTQQKIPQTTRSTHSLWSVAKLISLWAAIEIPSLPVNSHSRHISKRRQQTGQWERNIINLI